MERKAAPCHLQGHLAPLMRPTKFPEIPVSLEIPRPWYSPDKITRVGCHFLLRYMKMKSESEVARLCPTPSDPTSLHEIFLH